MSTSDPGGREEKTEEEREEEEKRLSLELIASHGQVKMDRSFSNLHFKGRATAFEAETSSVLLA